MSQDTQQQEEFKQMAARGLLLDYLAANCPEAGQLVYDEFCRQRVAAFSAVAAKQFLGVSALQEAHLELLGINTITAAVNESAAVSAAAAPAAKGTNDDEDADDVSLKGNNPEVAALSRGNGQMSKRPREELPTNAVSGAAPNNTAKVERKHFSRIDESKVTFVHDRLRDNRPGEEATSFRQNQEMMRVRGKEFSKHKQKNKNKLYAAGVVQDVRSFKFEDD